MRRWLFDSDREGVVHLQSFSVRNYRRLRDVRVELEPKTSIFVGSNNSGKTSAAKIFDSFLAVNRKSRFSFYDFSASCWSLFDAIGDKTAPKDAHLPAIILDLWFKVEEADLHRVLKILPRLDWKAAPVGVRLEYAPKNAEELLSHFHEAKTKAGTHTRKQEGKPDYHPWPTSLSDYLKKRLGDEYKIHYYVLDHEKFDEHFKPKADYVPQELGDASESGAAILRSIVRVDLLDAQRFQSDEEITHTEGLSKRLSRFYERNLEKYSEDFQAIAALVSSEQELNKHLELVFGPTLNRLNELGYPGFANPDLVIRSAFDPESILTKNASVHYALRDPGEAAATDQPPILPDKYNGLGFKNLIFMVIEVLDFHHQWAEEKEKRPPVHLVLIEEPEAHMHAQLQQVFINKIRSILPKEPPEFSTQMILTTHSPHIIYESSFKPIRYFRRMAMEHYSDVLSLSTFYETEQETRDFLYRYMKLTHCDLFFADAAILVEGNVERLLLPQMIDEVEPDLKTGYMSILEVGGAFAYKFRELVHFLGLTTLVITDLDSVFPKRAGAAKTDGAETTEDEEEEEGASKGCCMAHEPNGVTSNQTLRQWIPKLETIADLLAAKDEHKYPAITEKTPAKVRVAYQTQETVQWGEDKATRAGRTFEEAFAFQNLEWCQDIAKKHLGLRVIRKKAMSLDEVAAAIHQKVKSSSFKKTGFALALMQEEPKDWQVPTYIAEGLRWLRKEIVPPKDEKPLTTKKGDA